MSLQQTLKLNDGVVMPMFGLGLSKLENTGMAASAVLCAFEHGYRLIDTAAKYQNEEDLGRALKKCGLKREEIFVVSKVWHHGRNNCIAEVTSSLQKLDTPYIDLYLVHHPIGGKVLETYDTLLEFKQKGLIRSVGVSNFNIHHLEALKAAGRPLPSANQFELHPFQRYEELVDYCRKEGIAVFGYTPLARMQKKDDPLLNKLAQKYNRSLPQIMIRWSVQKGYITIPRSSSPQHIKANTEVFDFELSEDDMAILMNILSLAGSEF